MANIWLKWKQFP